MADQKRISMVLQDYQAPGLVDFLYSLPERYESAFIRGLLFQWLQENQGPELHERIEEVVNGPGGRTVMTTAGLHNRNDQAAPAARPRRTRPAPPPRQAQTVMPGVVPPPANVPGPVAQPVAAVPALPPAAAPVSLPPAAPFAPTPAAAPALPQPSTSPEPATESVVLDLSSASADDLETLNQLGDMF